MVTPRPHRALTLERTEVGRIAFCPGCPVQPYQVWLGHSARDERIALFAATESEAREALRQETMRLHRLRGRRTGAGATA